MNRFFSTVRIILADKLISLLSKSEFFTDRFFTRNRNLLVKENFEFPSILNNGYIHIERIVALAKTVGNSGNKIIIDIGAANGIISKMFSRNFPDNTIYCFEPIHNTFLELEENMEGFQNVRMINKALGSAPGETNINVLSRTTSSSILEVSDSIDDPFFAESLRQHHKEKIVISTLDTEIPSDKNISIIKMDVQGFELQVLQGGLKTLTRTDFIVLEMQNHRYYKNAPLYYELDNFLREQKFSCWDIIPSIRKNNKLMEWDAIYVSQRFLNELNG